MLCFTLILCLVCVIPTFPMKVNMQGSLKLGRDVVNSFNNYMRRNIISRRSFGARYEEGNTDVINLLVNSAFLCRNIEFCKDHEIVNEYVIALTKAVETMFEALVEKPNGHNPKLVIFEEELKILIREVKELLTTTNNEANDNTDIYIWLDLIKKISSTFRERALIFASHGLEGTPKEIDKIKKILTQKLTLALTEIELKFEEKLCFEQKICATNFEVTKALNTLFEGISDLEEDGVKQFIKLFAEVLPETGFLNIISENTAEDFQNILNDMAYSQNMETKSVLSIIHQSVKDRQNLVRKDKEVTGGGDVKLLHLILSDLDHIYDKQVNLFGEFLDAFQEWSGKGGLRLRSDLLEVASEIFKKISLQPEYLVVKLRNEVKVFLEITVDHVE